MSAERTYRRLLRILPASFRREAETELLEVFRRAHAQAAARGRAAQLRFWCRTVADLALTAGAEQRPQRPSAVRRQPSSPLWEMLMNLLSDVRLAVRALSRAPGFTAAAVLTFSLGIGVNVAVLSVVDRMMFRPLPYAEPDRLVHLHNIRQSGALPASYFPELLGITIRDRSSSFDGIASVTRNQEPVRLDGIATPLRLDRTSRGLLGLLKIRPIAGRDFSPEDGRSGTEETILLREEVWTQRFGRSADTLTTPFRGGRFTYRIVGILPRNLLIPSSALGERTDGLLLDSSTPRWSRPRRASSGREPLRACDLASASNRHRRKSMSSSRNSPRPAPARRS